MAIAAAFLSTTDRAHAQPSGAQAIHGQASLSQQGSKLVVTTQNGVGTSHSAINWQSFSVPGGSTTHFQQPGTGSLSINRVVGNDPSSIFGTLSSNGRLVLVNPAGIAVGAGAMVDTAGFTASTLRMSDANALAGRLVFGGDGLGGGALEVNGQILARSGDVVLIAPNVQVGSQALVQSPHGATMLAAGQKVELTGRGLEGIRLELQAPGDQALNLGALQGDAVGIFAGQLKHSGLIQATGITTEGGKVVLRASGDNLVDGRVQARAGTKGGSIDVLGGQVALFGNASLDASGAQGGGQVRVGGDYQGANAGVPNARNTFVGQEATINADAIANGDGGRVIVWADEATRFHGQISARGGEQGGNGGFAEVSGRQYLAYAGIADLRAPQGKVGTLLLDPNDITIQASGPTDVSQTPGPPYRFGGGVSGSVIWETDLENQLANSDVAVKTSTFSAGSGSGNITVNAELNWGTNALLLEADNSIVLNNKIDSTGMLIMTTQGTGSITQTAGSTIKVADLVMKTGNGVVTLNEDNVVGRLAASVDTLSFTNKGSLEIATLDRAGLLAGAFVGVTASNGVSITTKNGGDLKMTSAGPMSGGAIALNVAGSVIGDGVSAGAFSTFGGAVNIAAGGSITFDNITAQSPFGVFGIAGGNVGLVAGGSITGNGIAADGQSNSEGNGGAGGSVQALATGGNVSLGWVSAAAGNGSFGTGGDGGSVVLSANGTGAGQGNINVTGYLHAYGGAGAPGGNGGIVRIQAAGDVTVPYADVYGGDGSSGGNGANAGHGGTIAINVGRNLSVSSLYAGGGWGEDGADGGTGGNGGGISIANPNGSLVLQNIWMGAAGGPGGYGSSTGYAPNGLDGTIQAAAPGGVSISGYVNFDGLWANGGTMNISGSAGIGGGGLFVNSGEVNLSGSAYLDPYGGIENRIDGRINALSGNVYAGLGTNQGAIDIVAGATLEAPNFYQNDGKLRVNGTLMISGGYSCGECYLITTSVSGGSGGGYLTNSSSGIIAGNGTIDLDDGSGTGTFGTLYNYGLLLPGDVQPASDGTYSTTIGTLSINGNLNMAPGSVLAVDVASADSYDRVKVAGTTTFEGVRFTQLATVATTTSTTSTEPPPAQIHVTYAPGASFAAGSQFDVLSSTNLSVELEPQVAGTAELALAPYTSTSGLSLLAMSDFPVFPPAPPPLTGSTLDQMIQIIGDAGLAQKVLIESDNPLVTFTLLLKQEEERQAGDDKGLDNLVDNNQCRR